MSINVHSKPLFTLPLHIDYPCTLHEAERILWQVTPQVNSVEDQSLGTPLDLLGAPNARDEVVAVVGVRSEVKVPHRVARVVNGRLRMCTIHISRLIASQFDGIEEKAIGTAIHFHLAIHANDESLAVVGVAGHVDLVGKASIVHSFLLGLNIGLGKDMGIM